MLEVKVVAPDGVKYDSSDVLSVTIPTQDGVITVLEDHVPLISILRPGEVEIEKEDHVVYLAVSSGILQVEKNSKVTFMADTAERAEDINIEKAEEAKKRVEEFMKEQERVSDIDFAKLQAKIEKEMARIRVGKKYKR